MAHNEKRERRFIVRQVYRNMHPITQYRPGLRGFVFGFQRDGTPGSARMALASFVAVIRDVPRASRERVLAHMASLRARMAVIP